MDLPKIYQTFHHDLMHRASQAQQLERLKQQLTHHLSHGNSALLQVNCQNPDDLSA